MAEKKSRKRPGPETPMVCAIQEPNVSRPARQRAIEWLEGAIGESVADEGYNFTYWRELLTLARTREVDRENLERSIVEGESLA